MTSSFDAFAAAISAGEGWDVTSERPSSPSAGKPASATHDVILIFDGGSRGNPGHGYGSFTYEGCVVRWPIGVDYPGKITNNQAEYLTMIAGLRAIIFDCESLGIDPGAVTIEVRSDSQLVVNQINRTWKIKNAGMRTLHAQADELLNRFAGWDVIWHPRAESVRVLGH